MALKPDYFPEAIEIYLLGHLLLPPHLVQRSKHPDNADASSDNSSSCSRVGLYIGIMKRKRQFAPRAKGIKRPIVEQGE